jgi:hypothetical protein
MDSIRDNGVSYDCALDLWIIQSKQTEGQMKTPKREKIDPTFGQRLRACRLGWRVSDKHKAYVRLSCDEQSDYVTVSLSPLGQQVPKDKIKTHVCWWDNPALLDMIPALKGVKAPKKVIHFDIYKETGELVQ